MSDREQFQVNRDAGLAIRQQRRIETREELRRRTRREVAEEIAAAMEALDGPMTGENTTSDYLVLAAKLAREIGAR